MPVKDQETPVQELHIDKAYRNTNNWKDPEDEFNRFFRFEDGKGINNASGFRPKSRSVGNSTNILDCAFCVLVTNFGELEWPDVLDREQGIFQYYGDNRSPGPLGKTAVGGNSLLEHVFDLLHSGKRELVPPFLCFEKYRDAGRTYCRFLGLACPGGRGLSQLDDLVAVWRVADGQRFQNYRATFTVLREASVSKRWLEDLVKGHSGSESAWVPPSWKRWCETGVYQPLVCERKLAPRSRTSQMPGTPLESEVLDAVYNRLTPREFEFAAAELVQLVDRRFVPSMVTRGSRDGGHDVVARYLVGHDTHQVSLAAFVEAKRWKRSAGIGVRPMMRLISRIKHRDIGVFVTTSYFDTQVQEELIADGHPVILMSGGDIARILIERELGSATALDGWIAGIRAKAQSG